MSDEQTTVPVEPAQQQPANPTTPAVDWETRYKGASTVINKLTTDRDQIKAQLETATSELEQLRAQLALKETEKTVAVGERDKQMQTILEAKTQAESELANLRALKIKLDVAKKIGNPDLMLILDTIPSIADENALEALMRQVSDWGASLAKKRETELLAGVTASAVQAPVTQALPQSNADWQTYVNGFPLGSKEREEAFDAWKAWGNSLSS